ncbi:MAG: hypothetical protein WCT42_02330 [Candidatus Paceibacterota bacterium]
MRALISKARKVIFLHAVKAAGIEERKNYEGELGSENWGQPLLMI